MPQKGNGIQSAAILSLFPVCLQELNSWYASWFYARARFLTDHINMTFPAIFFHLSIPLAYDHALPHGTMYPRVFETWLFVSLPFWKCARGTQNSRWVFWLVFRPFPYELLNTELSISLYFDSRKPNPSCVGYLTLSGPTSSWICLKLTRIRSICLWKPGMFME